MENETSEILEIIRDLPEKLQTKPYSVLEEYAKILYPRHPITKLDNFKLLWDWVNNKKFGLEKYDFIEYFLRHCFTNEELSNLSQFVMEMMSSGVIKQALTPNGGDNER